MYHGRLSKRPEPYERAKLVLYFLIEAALPGTKRTGERKSIYLSRVLTR
jgi:hypothetical protein